MISRRDLMQSMAAAALMRCAAVKTKRALPLGIDMHNHVYPAGTEPHHPDGPALPLGEALTASGLTAVASAFVLDFAPNEKPGDAMSTLVSWIDRVDDELKVAGLSRALKAADLERPCVVQSVEGAHFIEGQLERVKLVAERGLRQLQLLHDKDDAVRPLGDTNTGVAHLDGLTDFGADVVRECNRLGLLIDLAHASHETVAAVLKISRAPVIISHTNLDTWTGPNARMAQMMKPRLISKAHAQVVADAGGIVGVWTHLTESTEQYVQSLRLMIEAIGVDHVGLGTDTDLLSPRGTGAGFFPTLVTEMERQGLSSSDIEKVCGANYVRVFGAATG